MNEEEYSERGLQAERKPRDNVDALPAQFTALIGGLAFIAAALAVHLQLIDLPLQLNFTNIPLVNGLLLVLGVFALSAAFHGYLGILVMAVMGIGQGHALNGNAMLLANVVPLVLAAYAGARLGNYAQADIHGKEDLNKAWKKTLILMALAIATSVVLTSMQAEWPAVQLPTITQ